MLRLSAEDFTDQVRRQKKCLDQVVTVEREKLDGLIEDNVREWKKQKGKMVDDEKQKEMIHRKDDARDEEPSPLQLTSSDQVILDSPLSVERDKSENITVVSQEHPAFASVRSMISGTRGAEAAAAGSDDVIRSPGEQEQRSPGIISPPSDLSSDVGSPQLSSEQQVKHPGKFAIVSPEVSLLAKVRNIDSLTLSSNRDSNPVIGSEEFAIESSTERVIKAPSVERSLGVGSSSRKSSGEQAEPPESSRGSLMKTSGSPSARTSAESSEVPAEYQEYGMEPYPSKASSVGDRSRMKLASRESIDIYPERLVSKKEIREEGIAQAMIVSSDSIESMPSRRSSSSQVTSKDLLMQRISRRDSGSQVSAHDLGVFRSLSTRSIESPKGESGSQVSPRDSGGIERKRGSRNSVVISRQDSSISRVSAQDLGTYGREAAKRDSIPSGAARRPSVTSSIRDLTEGHMAVSEDASAAPMQSVGCQASVTRPRPSTTDHFTQVTRTFSWEGASSRGSRYREQGVRTDVTVAPEWQGAAERQASAKYEIKIVKRGGEEGECEEPKNEEETVRGVVGAGKEVSEDKDVLKEERQKEESETEKDRDGKKERDTSRDKEDVEAEAAGSENERELDVSGGKEEGKQVEEVEKENIDERYEDSEFERKGKDLEEDKIRNERNEAPGLEEENQKEETVVGKTAEDIDAMAGRAVPAEADATGSVTSKDRASEPREEEVGRGAEPREGQDGKAPRVIERRKMFLEEIPASVRDAPFLRKIVYLSEKLSQINELSGRVGADYRMTREMLDRLSTLSSAEPRREDVSADATTREEELLPRFVDRATDALSDDCFTHRTSDVTSDRHGLMASAGVTNDVISDRIEPTVSGVTEVVQRLEERPPRGTDTPQSRGSARDRQRAYKSQLPSHLMSDRSSVQSSSPYTRRSFTDSTLNPCRRRVIRQRKTSQYTKTDKTGTVTTRRTAERRRIERSENFERRKHEALLLVKDMILSEASECPSSSIQPASVRSARRPSEESNDFLRRSYVKTVKKAGQPEQEVKYKETVSRKGGGGGLSGGRGDGSARALQQVRMTEKLSRRPKKVQKAKPFHPQSSPKGPKRAKQSVEVAPGTTFYYPDPSPVLQPTNVSTYHQRLSETNRAIRS